MTISTSLNRSNCIDKGEFLQNLDTGFIRLDSLTLDNDTKQKLKDSSIKKASWSGEDLDMKTLKQWLNSGHLDVDSKQVEIKSPQEDKISLTSDINQANTIQKDGYLLSAILEINYIQDNHQVLQEPNS